MSLREYEEEIARIKEMKVKTKQYYVSLSADYVAEIAARAEKERRSFSTMCRVIIEDSIDSMRREKENSYYKFYNKKEDSKHSGNTQTSKTEEQ